MSEVETIRPLVALHEQKIGTAPPGWEGVPSYITFPTVPSPRRIILYCRSSSSSLSLISSYAQRRLAWPSPPLASKLFSSLLPLSSSLLSLTFVSSHPVVKPTPEVNYRLRTAAPLPPFPLFLSRTLDDRHSGGKDTLRATRLLYVEKTAFENPEARLSGPVGVEKGFTPRTC
jgi:hypothetical protein